MTEYQSYFLSAVTLVHSLYVYIFIFLNISVVKCIKDIHLRFLACCYWFPDSLSIVRMAVLKGMTSSLFLRGPGCKFYQNKQLKSEECCRHVRIKQLVEAIYV